MRVVMVTDDVRIDRRILAESVSLAGHGHEVIIVAAWEEGLPRHFWHGPVKIERFGHDCPGPLAEDYGFPADEPLEFPGHSDVAQQLSRRLCRPLGKPEIVVRIRRSVGLIIRRSRALVVLTTAIRQSSRRLWNRILAILYGLARGGRSEDLEAIDEPPPVERTLVARLKYLDPDVIHAHDLPQLRVGVNVKRALGIPLIYDAHELYPELGTLTPRQKAMLGTRERSLLPECDRVITVNPLIAEEFVRRYDISMPLIVENAISIADGFCATARHDRFRQEFPIGKSDYILLYQGWFATHRGLPALIRAMPHVSRNVHLVFLGYGDDQGDLRALVDQMGVCGLVHLKDAVPQDELLFWTASADIGLIPYQADFDLNTRYCSPNKLYEYIGAGLPMLVNDELQFVRSVVRSNDFGRAAVLRTPDDFARAITSMVGEGRTGLDRFRENILRRRTEFQWSVEERKLLRLYDAVSQRPACVGQIFPQPDLVVPGRP